MDHHLLQIAVVNFMLQEEVEFQKVAEEFLSQEVVEYSYLVVAVYSYLVEVVYSGQVVEEC